MNAALFDYDIIVLSETWLSTSINNTELGLCNKYTIFRYDRCDVHGAGIRGGGVLIAVNKQFSCHRINQQNIQIEQLFVKISFKSYSLILCAIYIPPNSDLHVYNLHVDSIVSVLCNNSNSKFLAIGDYNLPGINWQFIDKKIKPQLFNISSIKSNILSCLSRSNLMQYNLIYNRTGSLLDLVFSNVYNIIVSSALNSLVPLDFNYHPALDISLPVVSIEYLDYKEQIYDFRHCNYNYVRSLIATVDWNGIFNNLCINNALDIRF